MLLISPGPHYQGSVDMLFQTCRSLVVDWHGSAYDMEIRIIELFNGQSNLDLANGFLDERVDNSYFAVLCYHNKGRTLVVVRVRIEKINGIDCVKFVFCCILVVFRS